MRSAATTHVWTIGRTELRRRWRRLRGNEWQLLAILVAVGFGSLFALLGIAALFFFGHSIQAGDIDDPLAVSHIGIVYGWLFVTGLGGYRIYATGLDPDHSNGLLTTVSHRELIGGLVVAELLLWGIPTIALGGIGALAFAVGAQSVLTAPLLFVTVCTIVALGILSGFALALAVKNSGARSRLLTRLRTVFIGLLAVGYFGVIFTQSVGSVLDPLVMVFAQTPLVWFGDLALLSLSSEASALRGFGALAIAVVGVAIAPTALGHLAKWLWYTDPVRVDQGNATADTPATESEPSKLASIVPRPIYGVARVDWARARRAPITLSFVLYPLILLAMPITTTVQTGRIGGSLPILVGLCGAWITGTLFTLNVLGNEGATLPVTVLGIAAGKTLVAGHVFAGAVIGVPLTAVGTIALGLASPMSPALVATFTLSCVVLALCAGPLASGIGTLFPRYEEVSVSRSQEAIIPSTIAFAAFSIALFIVAIPTLFVHTGIINEALYNWLGVQPLVLGLVGAIVSSLMAIVLGALSMYRSSRAVEEFHFD